MMANSQYPLKWLCDNWLALFIEAKKTRQEHFGQYAEECDSFYDSARDWMKKNYHLTSKGILEGNMPRPLFMMEINRVFEAVALFGPAMMHQYPSVQVTPIPFQQIAPEFLGYSPEMEEYQMAVGQQQQDSAVKQVAADLKMHYLNWLQVETNKKWHARRAITGGLVTGLGLLFNELYATAESSIAFPRSRYISWKQFLKDPDAEVNEDVQWIAIEWKHPVNLVEEKFGLPPGTLKGNVQSIQAQASSRGKKEGKEGRGGGSFDILTYTELYSKNGMGDKLTRSKDAPYDLSGLGKYVRLFFAKGVSFPLNVPPWIMNDPQAVIEAVQWPVPFWLKDAGGIGWPVSELTYYDKDSCVWPVSLFKPVISMMRFVNWCMSFLADKVAANAHDLLAVLKSAAKDMRDQLLGQTGPIKIFEISETLGQNINQVITRLEKGPVDIEIFKMVSESMTLIDKGTGLTELVYGLTGSQMRSATEAGVRNDRVSVRPDDMAQKTDDWYSETAMKEMACAATLLDAEDVAPVIGPFGTPLFEQLILSAHPESIMRDYSYRIAAGSARKPNKSQMLQSLNEFGRVALPIFQELVAAGVTAPLNAYLMDTAKAMDLQNPERYLVELPPPQQGPSPEEQQMMIEGQAKQQEMEMKGQEHVQKMSHSEEEHDQEMEHEREKMRMEMMGGRQKLELAAKQAKVKAKATAAKSNGSKK